MNKSDSYIATPLIRIDFSLGVPWVIPMPDGEHMRENLEAAIELGEVWLELMSPEEYWRWVFPKDCIRGGIAAELSRDSITVVIDFEAQVRGVKPGQTLPDPKSWRLQSVNFAHVFGALYRV